MISLSYDRIEGLISKRFLAEHLKLLPPRAARQMRMR